VAVVPEDFAGGEGDDLDRVLVFLIGDDLAQVRAEEGVVVEVERVARLAAGCGVAPEDALAVVDEQDAVVAAVGDQ